jgi:hypothetical protein
MEEAIEAIGGDGFLISTPFQRISRRFINEVCEGLVPALQRRGLARQTYTRGTLRETLKEFLTGACLWVAITCTRAALRSAMKTDPRNQAGSTQARISLILLE